MSPKYWLRVRAQPASARAPPSRKLSVGSSFYSWRERPVVVGTADVRPLRCAIDDRIEAEMSGRLHFADLKHSRSGRNQRPLVSLRVNEPKLPFAKHHAEVRQPWTV